MLPISRAFIVLGPPPCRNSGTRGDWLWNQLQIPLRGWCLHARIFGGESSKRRTIVTHKICFFVSPFSAQCDKDNACGCTRYLRGT